MKASIIIPTLNRYEDLKKTLISIENSTYKNIEIIVIDQGDINKTRLLIKIFKNINIKLYYRKLKSSAQARNFGVKKASGEILFFFDDDVYLNKKYIETAIKYFEKNPQIKGLTGKQTNSSKIRRFLGVLFNLYSPKNSNIITASAGLSPTNFDDKEKYVQWLQGFNMIYRKSIFEEGFEFNRNFIRWSCGEDAMLSYSIFKKYPKSLKYLPSLKIEHFQSPSSRMTNESLIKMKIIYKFIFWRKEVYKNIFYWIPFIWTQFGLMLIESIDSKNLKPYWILIKTWKYIILNYSELKKDTGSYNEFILNNK